MGTAQMCKLTSLLVTCVVAAGLAGCGGEGNRAAPAETPRESPTVSPTVTPAATPTVLLDPNPQCRPGGDVAFKPCRGVPAEANIFGAGRKEAPAPGGGGAGVVPPSWQLPPGKDRIITFPSVGGQVNPIIMYPDNWNGPAGDLEGPTDVESFEGISGIVHQSNGMFLVGVFLMDAPPSDPAPPRLDFTDGEQFDMLAPKIGQTFLVGDGKGRSYRVPSKANRLFLGFADAYLFEGAPGWYGNNYGELKVTVDVETN